MKTYRKWVHGLAAQMLAMGFASAQSVIDPMAHSMAVKPVQGTPASSSYCKPQDLAYKNCMNSHGNDYGRCTKEANVLMNCMRTAAVYTTPRPRETAVPPRPQAQ